MLVVQYQQYIGRYGAINYKLNNMYLLDNIMYCILSNKIKTITLVLYFQFHCHNNKDKSFTLKQKPAAKTPTNFVCNAVNNTKQEYYQFIVLKIVSL